MRCAATTRPGSSPPRRASSACSTRAPRASERRSRPVHVVHISFFVDPQRRPPQLLLRDWFPLVDVAAAVASAGGRVTVIQASTVTGTVVQAGAAFHFV